MSYERESVTAKKIRELLKTDFPNTKFSVRSKSYSGGGSINVYWTDGPAEEKVNKKIKAFQDVDYNQFGEVLMGANKYVFANREISPEIREKVEKEIQEKYNYDPSDRFLGEAVWRKLNSTDFPNKHLVSV